MGRSSSSINDDRTTRGYGTDHNYNPLPPAPLFQLPDGVELPAPLPPPPSSSTVAAAAAAVPRQPGAYQHSGRTRHTPAGRAGPNRVEPLFKGGRHVLGRESARNESSSGGDDDGDDSDDSSLGQGIELAQVSGAGGGDIIGDNVNDNNATDTDNGDGHIPGVGATPLSNSTRNDCVNQRRQHAAATPAATPVPVIAAAVVVESQSLPPLQPVMPEPGQPLVTAVVTLTPTPSLVGGDIESDPGGRDNATAEHREQTAAANASVEQPSNDIDNASDDENDYKGTSTKQKYICFGLILLLVVIILAVVFGVRAGKPNSSSTESSVTSINNPTGNSSSSSSLFIPFKDLFPYGGLFQSTQDAILSQNSKLSQFQAYQWIAQDPNVYEYGPRQLRQRFALATFYYATRGSDWFAANPDAVGDSQSQWLSYDSHECEWFSLSNNKVCEGYQASTRTTTAATKDQADHFNHFDYRQLILAGDNSRWQDYKTFPNPSLYGSLVPELALLTSLEALHVGSQQLKGTIPNELQQLSDTLANIFLYDNYFSGSIPALFYQFPLHLVTTDNTRLTPSPLPAAAFGNRSQLVYLNAINTGLMGSLPTELFAATRLQQLLLSENQLTSSLPTEIGQLRQLEDLSIGVNKLTGPLPSEIAQLWRLQNLLAVDNFFTGGIPTFLSQLTYLKWLILDSNPLGGTIPPELLLPANSSTASWGKLQELKLVGCSLEGSIPSEIAVLSSLTLLRLGGFPKTNQFTSTLPTEIATLTNLKFLGLANNQLSGSLESVAFLATNGSLKDLLAENNNFDEPVPAGLCGPTFRIDPLACSV